MSGRLNHNPANIVRWLLVAEGVVTDPGDNGQWPCYSPTEPPSPDNVVTVTGSAGVSHGRNHIDGEYSEHYGLNVRVRSREEDEGYDKANEIYLKLAKGVYRVAVTVGGVSYCVHSVRLPSGVLQLGYQLPDSKRRLFSVNGLAHITRV